MNGTKIEILAPLSQAIELTRRILFRPFNLEKWLVIGFAAFLAHLGGGGRFNFNFSSGWQRWRTHAWSTAFPEGMPGWFWPLLYVAVPFGLALLVLFMWIGARGRFIFTDCVVRDRGAIVAPWHEYRKEGNSLFLFSLAVAIILLAVFAVALLPVLMPGMLHHPGANVTFTLGTVFWAALLVIAGLSWWIISQLMVPVMYRQRCSAGSAFEKALALITSQPAELILFILLYVAVSIALALLVLIAGIMTCCIGLCLFSLPYVGTVILLPLEVFLFGYILLFLRQFGNEFDVWATLEAPPTQSIATPPPPVAPAAPPEVPPLPPEPPPRSPYEPPETPPSP